MRVEREELRRVRNSVTSRGARYGGANLEGATIDTVYALENGGFTAPQLTETGELERMVLYRCRPDWPVPFDVDDVVRRLENAWIEDAAFTHEAHTVTISDDAVALDFVTWWDHGAYYTGRIEVALASDERPPAKRGKRRRA